MLLMPIVFLIALAYRQGAQQTSSAATPCQWPPLSPSFLLLFVALVLLASAGWLSAAVVSAASDASRGLLLVAIAAAGVKTSFGDMFKLGWQPLILLLSETVFIASFMLVALLVLGVAR
jgi:uncharacterized membrane protein YadS